MKNHVDVKKRIWRHNSFRGSAMMMKKQTWAMADSDTLTPEARSLATQINYLSILLYNALKTRVDP